MNETVIGSTFVLYIPFIKRCIKLICIKLYESGKICEKRGDIKSLTFGSRLVG